MHRRQGQAIGHAIYRVAARPRATRAEVAILRTGAKVQVVQVFDVAAARDDVDRSSNGTRTGFCGGRSHNFNALDLLRQKFFQRKPAWGPLSIDHDLRITITHAAHGRRPATAGAPAADNAG